MRAWNPELRRAAQVNARGGGGIEMVVREHAPAWRGMAKKPRQRWEQKNWRQAAKGSAAAAASKPAEPTAYGKQQQRRVNQATGIRRENVVVKSA